MKTLTVELDDRTLSWLQRVAGAAQKPESALVREWIEERQQSGDSPSCFDLMRPLWRRGKGPPDLSEREGFGE